MPLLSLAQGVVSTGIAIKNNVQHKEQVAKLLKKELPKPEQLKRVMPILRFAEGLKSKGIIIKNKVQSGEHGASFLNKVQSEEQNKVQPEEQNKVQYEEHGTNLSNKDMDIVSLTDGDKLGIDHLWLDLGKTVEYMSRKLDVPKELIQVYIDEQNERKVADVQSTSNKSLHYWSKEEVKTWCLNHKHTELLMSTFSHMCGNELTLCTKEDILGVLTSMGGSTLVAEKIYNELMALNNQVPDVQSSRCLRHWSKEEVNAWCLNHEHSELLMNTFNTMRGYELTLCGKEDILSILTSMGGSILVAETIYNELMTLNNQKTELLTPTITAKNCGHNIKLHLELLKEPLRKKYRGILKLLEDEPEGTVNFLVRTKSAIALTNVGQIEVADVMDYLKTNKEVGLKNAEENIIRDTWEQHFKKFPKWPNVGETQSTYVAISNTQLYVTFEFGSRIKSIMLFHNKMVKLEKDIPRYGYYCALEKMKAEKMN